MKKKNKTLIVTIPLLFILLGFILYKYVYVGIETKVASIRESQFVKTKTLEKVYHPYI